MTTELVTQLRDALATALERYSMIEPDFESDDYEEDPLHEEIMELDAAFKAAGAFLASAK